VKDHITKLAKKGKTPSEIGVFLRDQHGIAQVRPRHKAAGCRRHTRAAASEVRVL
jgi:hypothetical protein